MPLLYRPNVFCARCGILTGVYGDGMHFPGCPHGTPYTTAAPFRSTFPAVPRLINDLDLDQRVANNLPCRCRDGVGRLGPNIHLPSCLVKNADTFSKPLRVTSLFPLTYINQPYVYPGSPQVPLPRPSDYDELAWRGAVLAQCARRQLEPDLLGREQDEDDEDFHPAKRKRTMPHPQRNPPFATSRHAQLQPNASSTSPQQGSPPASREPTSPTFIEQAPLDQTPAEFGSSLAPALSVLPVVPSAQCHPPSATHRATQSLLHGSRTVPQSIMPPARREPASQSFAASPTGQAPRSKTPAQAVSPPVPAQSVAPDVLNPALQSFTEDETDEILYLLLHGISIEVTASQFQNIHRTFSTENPIQQAMARQISAALPELGLSGPYNSRSEIEMAAEADSVVTRMMAKVKEEYWNGHKLKSAREKMNFPDREARRDRARARNAYADWQKKHGSYAPSNRYRRAAHLAYDRGQEIENEEQQTAINLAQAAGYTFGDMVGEGKELKRRLVELWKTGNLPDTQC